MGSAESSSDSGDSSSEEEGPPLIRPKREEEEAVIKAELLPALHEASPARPALVKAQYHATAERSLSALGFGFTRYESRKERGEGGIETGTPDDRCSKEQREVLESVRGGRNIFFTGSAGASCHAWGEECS